MLGSDPRNIANGWRIPAEGYCDQPYVVVTDEGHWLAVLTTGPGEEGDARQHVVSTLSHDHGQTWSAPSDIEPHGPPEASWAMPLKIPGGRIFVFYVYNAENVRSLASPDGTTITRVDTLGAYVFKYSDDHGRTWSKERYVVPVRTTGIDRANVFGGAVHFFWGVGKPIIHQGCAYLGAAKIAGFLTDGFMEPTEGMVLKSENILTEKNPAKIDWETLPDGDIGLRAPWGPIADEQNLVGLADGSLYCTYRSIDGFLCHAYSQDGAHTWDGPQHATYTPGGRKIKHPRAAGFVKKFTNGKCLLWYHNHGGRYYMDRNPAWIAGGIERDGSIHWSQPEVLLYDDPDGSRLSYPDFVEQDGRYWVTATQKTMARVHEIDPAILEGLWTQSDNREVARLGLAREWTSNDLRPRSTHTFPRLPRFDGGGGLTLDLWLIITQEGHSQTLVDTRNRFGAGLTLARTERGTLRLTLSDRTIEEIWESDDDVLSIGQPHHVSIIVDGGPRILAFVVDGVLCDGGAQRPKGWYRFRRALGHANGIATFTVEDSVSVKLEHLRVYDRPLRISEAVGNYRAGLSMVAD